VLSSTKTGEGLDQLRALLTGRISTIIVLPASESRRY